MRCFIAVDIDEAVRDEIADVQDALRRQSDLKRSEAKWVEPANIHLTLKFLGEVRDQDICEVCRIVNEAAADHGRFSIEAEGVGTFGRPARVVWAGISESQDLIALQEDIEQRLDEAGWPKEDKKFSAHLTLCRVKNVRAGKVLQEAVAGQADSRLGTVFVDSVCVYRSDLEKSGPVYTVISRSMLK
ncbi:MAG: RNA 2',3'-cyclic phosphodiesterase [Phycisphaerae bacterium]|nr:RNA 2',3'-cyclic phosphodiesterase [Phycisphaerae bacterium]